MLRQMETGVEFDIEFVSYNRQRKTGGALVTLTKARKHRAGAVASATAATASVTPTKQTTNPNHTLNGTINLKKQSGELHKVHTRLITKFNQQEVAL